MQKKFPEIPKSPSQFLKHVESLKAKRRKLQIRESTAAGQPLLSSSSFSASSSSSIISSRSSSASMLAALPMHALNSSNNSAHAHCSLEDYGTSLLANEVCRLSQKPFVVVVFPLLIQLFVSYLAEF